MFSEIVAAAVLIAASVQLVYCFSFFGRIYSYGNIAANKKDEFLPQVPVSILVCAHNEAANLKANLPAILQQQYHNIDNNVMYEVVVVNDRSTDETNIILNHLASQFNHLKVITLSEAESRTFPGKKFALSKALENATYDHVLMTDADCRPLSAQWLSGMAASFEPGIEIVAGFSGFYAENNLLNKFIRLETLHTLLQFTTYNLAHLPYMATGRNLACKKELFVSAQANPVWDKTPSGDDDLLISFCATGHNMKVTLDETTFTYSTAKGNIKEWIAQKQRHLSTGKYYKPLQKLLLGGYALSHAVMWIAFILLLIYPAGTLLSNVVFAILMLRCLVFWSILTRTADILKEKNLTYFLPFFDIGWMLYNFAFAPFIFLKNKKTWK